MDSKKEVDADHTPTAPTLDTPSDASESVPPSGYSTPLMPEPAQPLDEMQAKRFAFLLGQTDVFAHFIQGFIKDDNLKAEIKRQLDGKATKESGEGASRRHRKTEKEEDAELLREDSPEIVEVQQTFLESPSYVTGGKMRDYQMRGLNWMISLYENGINGILADEMGLGKTLQVISFIGYLKHYRGIRGPHLIVVPKSTLHNWKSEFNRWVPDLDVFLLHGDKAARSEIFENNLRSTEFNCCITTYEMCLICKSELRKVDWEYIIVDEAHRLKNENSMLSKLVRMFSSKRRLLITGTPLQNNLHELWALLNFLLPDVFGSSEVFDEWFHKEEGDQEQVVQQLHKVLQPFLLRRIKSDVEHSLLPKKEVNLYVGLTPMQRTWYRRILERDIAAINGAVGKKEGKTRLLNIVMQLRKCCNHPYLFDGAEPGPPYTTDEHLVYNSGKMAVLDKLLKRCKEQGSRVLIFSQMSRVLDILEDYCMFRGFNYCRLDGSTNHEERVESIQEFSRPDSDKFIFLLTTRAGGLGITLTAADTVCIYDSDWNPQADLQAMDRAHRIGQTKQVYVYRFITEDSVEEKVLERAMQKLRLDQLVIQQGRLAQSSKGTTHEQLLDMVQFGAENIFNGASEKTSAADSRVASGAGTPVHSDAGGPGELSGFDIDDILRRGESRTQELQSKYADMGLDDLNKFANESASTTQWEGEDYARKRRAADIAQLWIQPAKRERKVNYAVDDYYREALRQSSKTSSSQRAPRPPKQMHINDFQFYPPRLHELLEKELLSYRRQIGYKVPKSDAVEDGNESSGGGGGGVQSEEARLAEQARIDKAEALTEEESAEKEHLSLQGFGNWNRRDFYCFMRALENHGRSNMSLVKHDVEGKTPEEVEAYAKVFLKRYKELPEAERLTAQMSKGEQKRAKQNEIQQLLDTKLGECKQDPLRHFGVPYSSGGSTARGRVYTEEEDRFLLVQLARIGVGHDDVYDKIRQELRLSPLFRFDWFIKSRNSQEIQRRCQTLIGLLQKEAHGGRMGRNDKIDDDERFTTTHGSEPSPAAELYDVVIVGGGPAGCALAGALSSSVALADTRIALVDPGKLADVRQWEPPSDTYLTRTLQITSSNKQYLDRLGLWGQCFADRVQPYDRAIVTDALGLGKLDLGGGTAQEWPADGHTAYMIETKNLVGGLLRALDRNGHRVDVFERAKVIDIDAGSSTRQATSAASDWPVVTLSTEQRLRARLLVGADGGSSSVRKHAQIGTYGTKYGQYGLVATLCLEQLNQTAFQRFLPTGPIALLPFPGGFANLVWSLDADLVQVLKAAPEDALASLVNAAFRLTPPEMEYLYSMARAGASAGDIKAEAEWRLSVYTQSRSVSERWLPPTVAATSPRSRTSFPLHMRIVDRLVSERVALIGDAGHVMHPLAGQGLNMGLEDVQCLAAVLEQAVLAGEDFGSLAVLSRYNKQRYVRNLAMQGVVDKVWHVFGASAGPVVRARSLVMNALDGLPGIKRHLVSKMT
ncbi:chromatin remodeling complex Adenosinetriphosphatase [Coemansia aciculifera]|nr:chromatin remodeling complex Adenosinetriphosphatase [Coemansia aciculifera]